MKDGSNCRVKVAVVGVGNCASSSVQGVRHYREASPEDFVPWLGRVDLRGSQATAVRGAPVMKSPPTQYGDPEARRLTEELIAGGSVNGGDGAGGRRRAKADRIAAAEE